jgi:UDP-N-acetylglucosamine:LPS N-acetylglucosamine transferase
LKESELSGDLLAQRIREVINHPQTLQKMSDNSSRLARKNAASLVVATMEKYADHAKRS